MMKKMHKNKDKRKKFSVLYFLIFEIDQLLLSCEDSEDFIECFDSFKMQFYEFLGKKF